MGFPRKEYWSGLPFPSPKDLPHPGMEPTSPVLAGGFFTAESPRKLIPPTTVYLLKSRLSHLEKEMATHSSILTWRIPRTEEPGGLQSTGLQRVGQTVTSLSFIHLSSNPILITSLSIISSGSNSSPHLSRHSL